MRSILLLALCASPALAGPPDTTQIFFTDLAPADHGLWAIGTANCDEAGIHPAAVRIDGDGVEFDRDKVAKLAKSAVGTQPWKTGDDIYEPGEHARVSHDRGKTWQKLGIDRAVTIAGKGDVVWAIGWKFVYVTIDRGKTWTRDDRLAITPYRCL